ncbi:MAG: site-2 protease family protein [Anaerolineae bacterium]
MSWSIKLGRVFGIDIKVHLTFLLILVWGALNYGGSAGPLYGVLVTLGLFSLVLLHELGHSLAALRYGIPVKDITLLPIGGVARLERMPEKPRQELVVALAGPAVNVILALLLLPVILSLTVLQGAPLSLGLFARPGLTGFLAFLFSANVSLAVFNMLPAFPLDGGRVFRAALGFFVDYQRATQAAVTVGRFLAIGLGLIGIFSGQFLLALIALFIFTAGGQEGQAVAARGVLRNVQVGQAMPRNGRPVALQPGTPVGQVASMVMGGQQSDFAVLDPYSRQLLGVATSQDVARAIEQGQWNSPISDIMHAVQNVPRVTITTPLSEAQDALARTSSRVALVYDGLHFRGLLSLDDIYRVFRFLSRSGLGGQRIAWDVPG